MLHLKNRLFFTIAFLVLGSGNLLAQPMPGNLGGAPRPAFSPYLNLNRAGTSPAVNYFGIVRPQMQFQQSIQNLQGAVGANQQAIGNQQADSGIVSTTGHYAGFMNYNAYFLNNSPVMGQGGFGAAGLQRQRFSTQNLRTPAPGFTGVIPGASPQGFAQPQRRR